MQLAKGFGAIAGSVLLACSTASATSIGIDQFSIFLAADELGPTSLENTQIGFGVDDFAGSGIDLTFSDAGLGADNLGSVSWDFTNTSFGTLTNARVFVFLDAAIAEFVNVFDNESGEVVSVTGAGASDNLADSFEIDEPGFFSGDIFDNLLDGALDNQNQAPADEDVSLALGFELGTLNIGDSWTGVFQLSLANIGGLRHNDPDSDFGFFFNGIVDVSRADDPVDVPVPSTVALFGLGLICLRNLRRNGRNAC